MAQSSSRRKQQPAEPEWVPLAGAGPYADMIRVTTGERHVLLSFGQSRPGARPGGNSSGAHIVTVAQVYLPLKTAGEFLAILGQHVSRYQKRTGQRITPEGLNLAFGEEE